MADGMSSFWGPVTSTTQCCEKNYVYSSYVAEFFNTISNIPCILLALVGLMNSVRQRFEKRFTILHISNMILAIGSMLYHTTLQRVFGLVAVVITLGFSSLPSSKVLHLMRLQQSDETPIVWEILLYIYILYSPDWHYHRTMPTFLFLYGAVFGVVHSQLCLGIGFKVHVVILCLLCFPRMYKYFLHTEDIPAKWLAKLYAVTLSLGTLCWLFDRAVCEDSWLINPQGHALWHILMGFNAYFANTFLMFCRAQHCEWKPKILYYVGILPYVKIRKPKCHQS